MPTWRCSALYPVDKPSLFEDKKARRQGIWLLLLLWRAQPGRLEDDSGKDSEVSIGPGGGVLLDLIPLLLWVAVTRSRGRFPTRGGSLTARLHQGNGDLR